MSDYFLIHRALQVQRLCSPEAEHGIELPGRFARDGLPAAVVAFLRCVDRIRKLSLDEQAGGGIRHLLRLGRPKPDSRLTPKQRSIVLDCERQLIELRLSDDPQAQQLATACIQAIIRDQSFFYGLKPLAQHTDDFAYELLYPTWLNLYTAMRLRAADGTPKFSEQQVREVFDCLRDIETECRESSQPMVGLLTFIANRLTTAEALKLTRQVAQMFSADSDSAASYVHRIDSLLERSPTADVLQELIISYLIVERCLQGERNDRPENSTCKPLPKMLVDKLWELLESPDEFSTFGQLLTKMAKIADRAGGFDRDFGRLFQTGNHNAVELIDLCLSSDEGQPAFSCQVQRIIARLMKLEALSDPPSRPSLQRWAQQFGRRMDVLDPKDLRVFAGEFIEKDKNRAVLLALASDRDKRQRVAQQLLEAARKESDLDRFFYRLQVAAVIGSWQEFDGLEKIQRSIKVLLVSKREDSISSRELTELTDDLRKHLPESLAYLESPGFAGRGKPDRLARIYLALNEACQLAEATGRVPNFGLVRAGFRILDQMAEE